MTLQELCAFALSLQHNETRLFRISILGKKKEKEKKRRECKKYSAFNFPWRYRNLTQLCLESKTEQAIEI